MQSNEENPDPIKRPIQLILLTGAGASVPLGLPDTKGLLQQLTGIKSSLDDFIKGLRETHHHQDPDIEWILERLDLYDDINDLLGNDKNLASEIRATIKDVVSKCEVAAGRIRAAFPKREFVMDDSNPYILGSYKSNFGVGYSQVNGIYQDRNPYEGVNWLPSSQLSSSPLMQDPRVGYRNIGPPPFEPGVDIARTAETIISDTVKQSKLLRQTVYENIIRIYGNVDRDSAFRLYSNIIGNLRLLADKSSLSALKIFTTNWDPTFEALKDRLPFPIETGMAGDSYERYWDPTAYDKGKVDVYHLHGCCRWLTVDEGQGRIAYNPLPTLRNPNLEVPVLYRPRSKMSFAFDEPYSTAYAALERATTNACIWLIIGYSFRDTPIQRILERAALRKTLEHVVIVNPADMLPYPVEIKDKVIHIRGNFGDAKTEITALNAVVDAIDEYKSGLSSKH